MKSVAIRWALPIAVLFTAIPAHASGWFACGNLAQIGWSCQLTSYPNTQYEYGIAYNSSEPLSVNCSYWNYGLRVYNKLPYNTFSDNPLNGSSWGGFMFYTSTLSPDDDTCSGGTWRHQYWSLGQNNVVSVVAGNGCIGSGLPIYCRAR